MNGQSSLRQNYEGVLARIRAACERAGRPADTVRLLAVSKTFDADQVLELALAGQRAFGENYLQEALPKISHLKSQRPEIALEWHFIGPIQSNKTRQIAESFDWVHSVDRERVARRLSEQRPGAFGPLQVCVQVNVSGETSKSGCAPQEVPALARVISQLPRLQLRGVMAIPEPTDDPAVQHGQLAHLRRIFEGLRTEGLPVDTVSMGMSADLEPAIAEGSTMVRIGTALFGDRPKKAPLPQAS